jgi:hypothetical protein
MCDYCGSDTSLPQNHPGLAGWKHTPEGKDACPTCLWAIECGETPGPSTHPTVRPLPSATRTQRPGRVVVMCAGGCGSTVAYGGPAQKGWEAYCLKCAAEGMTRGDRGVNHVPLTCVVCDAPKQPESTSGPGPFPVGSREEEAPRRANVRGHGNQEGGS